jgi:Flp pilus assembly protein TadD
LGLRDEAKLDLINSLILDSNQPKVKFNVGMLYLDLKMPEKAVPELLKALEISRMQSGSFIDTKHLA